MTVPGYPAPGYTAPQFPQPPPGAWTGPIIHFEADRPTARLQKLQLRWVDVCTLPCDIPVDPYPMYRVGGSGIMRSKPFQIPRPTGQILVTAKTGSVAKHWVGGGMALGGILMAAYGIYILALSGLLSQASRSSTDDEATRAFAVIGGGLSIGGGVLMAFGGSMWYGNYTQVQVE